MSADTPLIRVERSAFKEHETANNDLEKNLDDGRRDLKDVIRHLTRIEAQMAALPNTTWIGTFVVGGITSLALSLHFFGH